MEIIIIHAMLKHFAFRKINISCNVLLLVIVFQELESYIIEIFYPGNKDETALLGRENGFEKFSALYFGAAGLLSLLIVDF